MINSLWINILIDHVLIKIKLRNHYTRENCGARKATAQFKATWSNNRLSKWTRGHSPNCVVNNNGLEGTNGVIKNDGTQHRFLPVMTFFREII